MNYHLNRQGQNVGVFPLEELRRRRGAGECQGDDLVWCEGMPTWQWLDSVLQTSGPGSPGSAPPVISTPIAKRKTNRTLVVAMVAGAVLVLAVLTFLGIAAVQFAKRVRPVLDGLNAGGGGRVGGESALALASKPALWNTNTMTEASLRERNREFRVRQYLAAYQEHGQRNSSSDAAALRLIESWIASNFGRPGETNLPSLTQLSDQLAADPACNDPIVLTVAAVNSIELHEMIRRLERAVNGFQHSQYKAYPKFYATSLLATKILDAGQTQNLNRVAVLDASALQWLKEALNDGSLLPEDQAQVAETLVSGWGRGFFSRNAQAIQPVAEASGKTFQWLALVLEGEYQIIEAWKARGGGYADTVADKGWQGFREHLAQARKCLTEAWRLRPDLPMAPSRMIYVSLGDSDIGEMRLWFDRTVAAQLDYAPAWKDLRWGLRPRWYGDHESMLALGITAANTRRFDTDVPRMLFDAVQDLESDLELPRGRHIYGRADIWPHLQKMYEGYIAEPSLAAHHGGWQSAYAAVAYLAGKYDVARQQLEAVDWTPAPRNLVDWGTDLSLMPWEVAARTSPVGPQINTAEARRDRGDTADALRIYTGLKTAANLDERTQTFIADRLATLDLEARLQKGGWVDFLPSGDRFTGWCAARGRWQSLPDGALEVQSGHDGHILYSRARIGTEFEVKGEFETVRSSTKAFQAGMVMGIPEYDAFGWDAFRLKRNGDEGEVISFSQHWTRNQVFNRIKLNSSTNSFYFRLRAGKVSASVNGDEILRSVTPPANRLLSTNEFLLGLGAFNDMNDTVVRYRNIQIRKL